MADLIALRARRGELVEQIANLTAEKISAERVLARAQSDLQFTTDPAVRRNREQQIQQAKGIIAKNNAELVTLNAQLAEVDRQIAVAQQQQGSRESTGETVPRAQRARDDAANTAVPPPEQASAESTTSNAERFEPETTTDLGTDDPPNTAEQNQSLPPRTAFPGGPVPDDAFGDQPTVVDARPTSQAGAASPKDDASGGAAVRARINSIFGGDGGRIVPQGNVLDQYSSYAYSISIYLLSPEDYQQMLKTKRPPSGWQLLIQSAGAAQGGGIIPGSQLGPEFNQEDYRQAAEATLARLGRNQFFRNDYYIDDVSIRTLISGKGTNGAHNAVALRFKLLEPNGITLLDNLYKATREYVNIRGGNSNSNYAAQTYLMAIRFYGYDQNGNLVSAQRLNATDLEGKNYSAVVEKFIPFQFTGIKFRVANKVTEYECDAVCPQNMVNTGPARGVIPYNIELSSQSLKDLLTGPLGFAKSESASKAVPDNARAAATPTNAPQRYNPRRGGTSTQAAPSVSTWPPGGGEFADLFNYNPAGDFQGPAATITAGGSPTQSQAPPKADAASRAKSLTITQGLSDALNKFQEELVTEGVQELADIYEVRILEPVLKSAKLVPPGEFNPRQSAMIKAQTAKEQKDGKTQSMDTNSKTTKVIAGTSVVQFIDQVCRTSSYILEQQTAYIDSKTGKQVENGTPAQTIGWYRIGLQAEPTGKYDNKRNDYQYKITYSLAAYQVNQVKSDFFPRTQFLGTHKKYNYWFTGENTQILDFQQDYNYLYYIVQNTNSRPKITSNYREADRYFYQPRSPESSQGQDDDKVYEPSAQAADYLYSPADQSRIKLQIVGDPAWIFQGESTSGIQGLQSIYGAFLPDGTINPEGRQVLFEVAFNRPTDYDINTGLIDPGINNYGADRSNGVAGDARQSFIYQAVECTSSFSKGKFTQELNGVLQTFPLEEPTARGRAATEQQRTNTQTAQTRNTAAQANRSTRNTAGPTGARVGRGALPVRVRPDPPLTGSLTDAEFGGSGSGDGISSALGTVNAEPLASPQPPTSATQTVGPAATGSAAIRSQGGAAGSNVGQPATFVVLSNGRAQTVTSQSEINALVASGRVSAIQGQEASRTLSLQQQAANNPRTTANRQTGARES